MRWKLLLIASALAALAAALASFGAAALLGADFKESPLPSSGLRAAALLAAPALAVAGAGFFVYRHTARRRPLQVALTVAASSALALAAVYLARLLLPA